MNYKVFTISMCHNDPAIIEESIAQYYATKHPSVQTEHVLVDAHWPIDYPNFRKRIEALAQRFGCRLEDPGKNLGLHGNFNYAWNRMAIPDNAMVIGYDPDSWPVTPGWDLAMCEAFVGGANIGWLSLWHQHAERELFTEGRRKAEGVVKGVRLVYLKFPCLNSVCGFRQSFLRKAGGLFEQNPYYGGLECDLWPQLQSQGLEWVFLRDYQEAPHFEGRQDPRYRDWKYATTHLKQKQVSFEEWVKKPIS